MLEEKNIYVAPKFDIFYFEKADVITASWDSSNSEMVEGDEVWG